MKRNFDFFSGCKRKILNGEGFMALSIVKGRGTADRNKPGDKAPLSLDKTGRIKKKVRREDTARFFNCCSADIATRP